MARFRFRLYLASLLGLALAATACAQAAPPAGPRGGMITRWIGRKRLRAGVPLTVLSHVFAPEGVADTLLSVNGQAYRRSPPAQAKPFSQVNVEWRPEQPGTYDLTLVAFTTAGKSSQPARVRVEVVGEPARRSIRDPHSRPGPSTEARPI